MLNNSHNVSSFQHEVPEVGLETLNIITTVHFGLKFLILVSFFSKCVF